MSHKMLVSFESHQEELLKSQVATDPGAAPAGATTWLSKRKMASKLRDQSRGNRSNNSIGMLEQLPFAKMPPPPIDPAQHCMATLPWIICYILRQGKNKKDKNKYAFQLLCALTNLQAAEVDEPHQFASAYGYSCIRGRNVECSTELLAILKGAACTAWAAEASCMGTLDKNSEKSLPAFLWSLSAILRTPKRHVASVRTLACQLCNELIARITLQADYWASKQPNASVNEMIVTTDRGPKGHIRKTSWYMHAIMNTSRKPQLSGIEQHSCSKFLISTQTNVKKGNGFYLRRLTEEPHSCRICYFLAQPLSLLSNAFMLPLNSEEKWNYSAITLAFVF